MSANAFYRELRAEGIAARRSEVLSLYKVARGLTATAGDELFRDPYRIPSGDELQVWPTKTATGIHQNVQLIYRDRITGSLSVTHWGTVSESGITRETAMATAINAYSEHADAYGQDLIGAVHTGARINTPFMA